jgi:lipopolysaccharide/colanic/teichoic acid biosynthesis glycosyltransferase
VIEFGVALVLLVLAAPTLLLAAVLVKLTSRGPALYTQTRLGLNGRLYTIYKLRSMYHNCEQESGPLWSPAGDPRITRLGRFLRRIHLDELPQLWNVLRSEMGLVGPRPERPEFLPDLEQAVPLYRSRLRVRPGVTGLAQVQLPPDTGLDSVRRKVAYDLYYVRHCNPLLDLQILVATGLKLLGLSFPVIRRITHLPSRETIEQYYAFQLKKHGYSPSHPPTR